MSTCNEETQENKVCVFRKARKILDLGPYRETVLDLKSVGNKVFINNGKSNVDRIEIKGL